MSNRLLTIKVTEATREMLVEKMVALGIEVIDARQCLQALAC